MEFFDSLHCKCRLHCDFCRNNRPFRESLFKAGMVEEVDFTDCPEGYALNQPVPGARKAAIVRNEEMKTKGPIIWKGWHTLANKGKFPGHDAEWIKEVPCGECRRHAREALARCPFRAADQAQWMIDYHNEINAIVGNPQFKIDIQAQIG